MKRNLEKVSKKNVSFESFDKFLGRDINILRFAGLYTINNIFTDNIVESTIWETLIFVVVLCNLSIIMLSECHAMKVVWSKDPGSAIIVMTSMVTVIVSIVKGLRLWICREELCKLLKSFGTMWDDLKSRKTIREEIIKIATRTSYVGKVYAIIMSSGCISYAARPYLLLQNYYWYTKDTNKSYDYTMTVFPAIYPWSTSTISRYIICVLWEQFIVIFLALYMISSNGLFAQLTTHAAIQFRVLGHDLQALMNNEKNYKQKNEKELIRELSRIAERHHVLYTYCARIQSLFDPTIFVTLMVTALNLCSCAFYLQKELAHGNWIEVVKSVSHASIVTADGFIYCGYADKLTRQTSMVAQAAYESEWMERSKEFKTMLHIIMLRSQKSFNYTGYGFFAVNLIQMTRIFNAAGSYFALLKSVA